MRLGANAGRRQRGFTLIELLVVIVIIGVLAALTASTALRLIGTQKNNNSQLVVHKVDDALKRQWSAVVEQAKGEDPDSIMGPGWYANLIQVSAGNDQKRARVIWIKM